MRLSNGRRRHGGSVSAPDERFSIEESPVPPGAGFSAEGEGSERSSRFLSWLRVTLGVVAVVGSSVAVAASAHRYALTSPRFSVREIELKGAQRLSLPDVREIANLQVGTNIFALDTHSVEARLLQNPWILTARVVRQLPGTLQIELSERQAKAIAALTGHLYLVSSQGEPFKQLEAKDPLDLPVITGFRAENLQRDRPRELERLKLGLDVLEQYGRLSMSRVYAAQEVHLAEGGAVTLMVGRDAIVINLGTSGFRQRLLMSERVIEETRQSGGRLPALVFADNQAHPERVVVRMH